MAKYNSLFSGPGVDQGVFDGSHALYNFAQEFGLVDLYFSGDLVTRDGYLYRCTGVTGQIWDATKWERVLIEDLFPLYQTVQIGD